MCFDKRSIDCCGFSGNQMVFLGFSWFFRIFRLISSRFFCRIRCRKPSSVRQRIRNFLWKVPMEYFTFFPGNHLQILFWKGSMKPCGSGAHTKKPAPPEWCRDIIITATRNTRVYMKNNESWKVLFLFIRVVLRLVLGREHKPQWDHVAPVALVAAATAE